MWQTLLKRTALVVLACALALTFTQSGATAAVCLIERGLDPLDVVKTGTRHNVWVVLDTSGSMGGDFGGGQDQLEVAIDVLTQLMTVELVDASGDPLVNWGYVNFNLNPPNPKYRRRACAVGQFGKNQCTGLDLARLMVR